jgi:hypothetical protein
MVNKYSFIITPKGVVLCGEWGAMTALQSAKDLTDLRALLDTLTPGDLHGEG